jgi:hypothetical protein
MWMDHRNSRILSKWRWTRSYRKGFSLIVDCSNSFPKPIGREMIEVLRVRLLGFSGHLELEEPEVGLGEAISLRYRSDFRDFENNFYEYSIGN